MATYSKFRNNLNFIRYHHQKIIGLYGSNLALKIRQGVTFNLTMKTLVLDAIKTKQLMNKKEATSWRTMASWLT